MPKIDRYAELDRAHMELTQGKKKKSKDPQKKLLADDFPAAMDGKKKKKDKKHKLSSEVPLDETLHNNLEGKKKKDKKHKLFVDKPLNESLDSNFQDVFSEKKKKKKKKHKSDVNAPLDETLDCSLEDGFSEKKKKKKRNSVVDTPLEETLDYDLEDGFSEKKKKKKRNSFVDTPLEETLDYNLEDGFSEKKKKKKRNSFVDTPLEETLDYNLEETPKKKKHKKGVLEDVHLEIGREPLKNLEKSPKINSIDIMDRDSTPKSSKKRKSISVTEIGSVESSSKIGRDSDSHLSKSPYRNAKSSPIENLKIKHSSEEKRKLSLTGESSKMLTDNLWSVEEEIALVDKVLSHLKPVDVKPYKGTLKNIKWEDVILSNRSSEECRQMLINLISKIHKFKTLTMILEELKTKITDSQSKFKDMSAKQQFIMQYCKTNRSKVTYKELPKKANEAWSALSRKEQYNFDRKNREMMHLPPDVPRSSYTIFVNHEEDKQGVKESGFKSKCVKVFREMEFEEKRKYILECIKEWAIYIRDFKAFIKSHPECNTQMAIIPHQFLIKQYLVSVGMPNRHRSPAVEFREALAAKGELKGLTSKDQIQLVNSKFRQLSEEEKKKYRKASVESRKSSGSIYNAWKLSVDEDIALVAETYFGKDVKSVGANMNSIEVSMAKPNFPNAPKKPPQSAFRIFIKKFEDSRRDKYKSYREMAEACSAAWRDMSDKSRLKYKKRYEENRATYKESLLEFARNLGSEVNIFLGFYRLEFMTYFRTDIFEDEFPNEKYPVYTGKPKFAGVLTRVIDGTDVDDILNDKNLLSPDSADNKITLNKKSDPSKDYKKVKSQILPVDWSDDESNSDNEQLMENDEDSEDEDSADQEENVDPDEDDDNENDEDNDNENDEDDENDEDVDSDDDE